MGIPMSSFRAGNVYIDFPYEEVLFRFEKATGKVFRKFYGEPTEEEVAPDSNLYAEACIAGKETTLDEYRRGRPRRSSE
jgi:hypothetical protein